jgi:hypothetical protein
MSETQHTPGYGVSKDGRVFSLEHNWRGYGQRELVQQPNTDGYMRVRMVIDGRRKSYMVHKLVAAVFLDGQPSPRHEIRHLNGDKRDNRAVNLSWGTRRENAADRERHGRTSRGERHSAAIRAGLARGAA